MKKVVTTVGGLTCYKIKVPKAVFEQSALSEKDLFADYRHDKSVKTVNMYVVKFDDKTVLVTTKKVLLQEGLWHKHFMRGGMYHFCNCIKVSMSDARVRTLNISRLNHKMIDLSRELYLTFNK